MGNDFNDEYYKSLREPIGARAFVQYYESFRQQLSNDELLRLFEANGEDWEENTSRTKANQGRRIFSLGVNLGVLRHIVDTCSPSKVGQGVIEEAKRLLLLYDPSDQRQELHAMDKMLAATNLDEKDKYILIKYRVGQGVFRKRLYEYWGGCSVTGCREHSLLIASHIKPYSECRPYERYDLYNGLLLTPNLDRLFDRHLISFDEQGKIMVSSSLNSDDLACLGISGEERLVGERLDDRHEEYLVLHRAVFRSQEAGEDALEVGTLSLKREGTSVINTKGNERMVQTEWSPVEGENSRNFLAGKRMERLPEKTRDEIASKAKDILAHCVNPAGDEAQQSTVLVYGCVQSGKTLSYTYLTALASDNGYRMAIYLTGVNTNLQKQTYERLDDDLNMRSNAFYLPDVPSEDPRIHLTIDRKRAARMLEGGRTVLLPVMKNRAGIQDVITLLKDETVAKALGSSPVLIIDDESDNASLNNRAYSNSKTGLEEKSTTYEFIEKLRECAPRFAYVEYTATPHANFLIEQRDMLRPDWCAVLEPGEGYTGAETFFAPDSPYLLTIPSEEMDSSEWRGKLPGSLQKAIAYHLLNVAVTVDVQERLPFLTMMIHCTREYNGEGGNERIFSLVEDFVRQLRLDAENEGSGTKLSLLDEQYQELKRTYDTALPDLEELRELLGHLLSDPKAIRCHKLTQDGDEKIDWGEKRCKCHIVVGGDKLGRGFTLENLTTSYLSRWTSGTPTADTLWQRARFFGYKKDYLEACRVYMPEVAIDAYRRFANYEVYLRDYIRDNASLEGVEWEISEKIPALLNATRQCIQREQRGALVEWFQLQDLGNIEANDLLVEEFLRAIQQSLEPAEPQGNTPAQQHLYASLERGTIASLLRAYKSDNDHSRERLERIVSFMARSEAPVHFYYMSHSQPRPRTLEATTGELASFNVGKYDGGSFAPYNDFKGGDSITVQLYRIRVSAEGKPVDGVETYGFRVFIPDSRL